MRLDPKLIQTDNCLHYLRIWNIRNIIFLLLQQITKKNLMESLGNFHLSQALKPHAGAVRALDAAYGWAITGSIDKTCKIFQKVDGRYILQNEIDLFEDYIFATLVRGFGKGFIVAAKNSKIFLLDLLGNPEGILEGHTGAVNSISESPSGKILISGSWDGTAIVWDLDTQTALYKLEGHSHAVSTIAIDDERFITGSQDRNIHFWSGSKKTKTIKVAHEDIIREFKKYGDFAFLSCSNDEIVKLWSLDGELITTFAGHTAFIFSICAIVDKGIVVSGSDDKTIKVWQSETCIQTVAHPGTVWAVRADSDGDILTGCADGFTRVFSSDPKRIADKEEIDEFESQSSLANMQGPEGISEAELAKLPDSSQMEKIKGKKDGEVKIFKTKGVPEAYVWKASGNYWEKIGEVISGPPKKHYEGDKWFPAGEYDYVFDIEDDSGVPRKLPYNEGDNPLEVAEKFLVKEGLQKGYLEQICTFIRKNTRGGGKPVQQKQQQTSQIKQDFMVEEFTGSNYFPSKQPIYFEGGNFDAMTKKLLETQVSDPTLNLEEKDKKAVLSLVETLKGVQLYHSSSITDMESVVLTQKLLKWPGDVILPVLDLFRLVVLHPNSEKFFAGVDAGYSLVSLLSGFACSHPNDVAKAMALRTLCNLAKHTSNRYSIINNGDLVLDALEKLTTQNLSNKLLRNAISTLVFNLSVLYPESKGSDKCPKLLELGRKFLAQEQENDNIGKYLMAFGNLLVREPSLKSNAKSIGLPTVLGQIEGFLTTTEAKECLQDLRKII